MKKVMVIGANGFIGRNLVTRLASMGIHVVALIARGVDKSLFNSEPNIVCLEFELAGLADLNDSEEVKQIDTIYHLAWAGVGTEFKNQADVQAQNILYGLSVMEFAKRHHISKVIVPGSAAEYSCGDGIIDGTNAPAPSDLYSAAKVATRFLCQTYAQQNNLDLIWTAITSIYGPGRNDNNLITYAIKSLLNKNRPQFTGLEQRWDYLYIDDLITALILLGEKGKGGKIYPIGSGISQQMLEYVNIIRDAINPELPVGIGELPYKSSKIDNQVLDIGDLKSDTGFEPKYSFQEGIKLTIEYFKEIVE